MIITIYTDTDGVDYKILPKKWEYVDDEGVTKIANPFTWSLAVKLGWTKGVKKHHSHNHHLWMILTLLAINSALCAYRLDNFFVSLFLEADLIRWTLSKITHLLILIRDYF